MNTYFSSDYHLSHKNVIKYDNRPFKSVEEMDHTIISNTVHLLGKGDDFYFLGDLALTASRNTMEGYIKALLYTGANLFFIKGNHDHSDTIKLYKKYGTYLGEQKSVVVLDPDTGNEQVIVLNHYRLEVWDRSHHGSWHLHGHSHHNLPEKKEARCMDVGINGKNYEYKPVSYQQVKDYMSKKVYKPIDHHGKTGRL